jgi:hypothetical protein
MPETIWLCEYAFDGKGKVLIEADTKEEAREKLLQRDYENEREWGTDLEVIDITINKSYLPDDYTGGVNLEDVKNIADLVHCFMLKSVGAFTIPPSKDTQFKNDLIEEIRTYFINPEIKKEADPEPEPEPELEDKLRTSEIELKANVFVACGRKPCNDTTVAYAAKLLLDVMRKLPDLFSLRAEDVKFNGYLYKCGECKKSVSPNDLFCKNCGQRAENAENRI